MRTRGAFSTALACLALLQDVEPGFAAAEAHDPHEQEITQLETIVYELLERAGKSGGQPLEVPADGLPTQPAGSAVLSLDPTDGSAHHLSLPLLVMAGVETPGRKRWTAKPPAEIDPTYLSNSSNSGPADLSTWRQIRFSSGSYEPLPGLGTRFALEAAKEGRDLYGFLVTDQDIDSLMLAKLQELGVSVLGVHSGAYKVRVQRDLKDLAAVVQLPYVISLDFPEESQKLSRALKRVLEEVLLPEDRYPIVINLFELPPESGFREELEAAGVVVASYDEDLVAFDAVASRSAIEAILEKDFVLFVELIHPVTIHHSQSTPLIGADYIRPGSGVSSRFSGSSTILGIMDSGFMIGSAAETMHNDLNKFACGLNFTTDAAGPFNDEHGHGTHVLGTIIGDGTADSRMKGMATGVGGSSSTRVRAAKVFTAAGTGSSSWVRDAMDWLDNSTACSSGRPAVINYSGGSSGTGLTGTDATSRKLDDKVWGFGQLYVISAGNDGPGGETVGAPGVAKNALTVANVFDFDHLQVGDLNSWNATQCAGNGAGAPCASSRGPTGDSRMKPNVSAPGTWVTSANAGTTNGYRTIFGTSMAAPHVAGLAATLMQHYSDFNGRPYLARAHLMASTLLHNDNINPITNDNTATGDRIAYGMGRVSSFVAHWARTNSDGWTTHWSWGTVTSSTFAFRDITVPSGADRLVVVLTWDEPSASAGAASAVIDDIDLWVDRGADCTGGTYPGGCGEYHSYSTTDNVEYLIIENPPSGTYRLKAAPWSVSAGRPVGIAAVVIRGDTTPSMNHTTSVSDSTPDVNEEFTVTTTVSGPSWITSGVHLEMTSLPGGVTFLGVTANREDNVNMDFGTATEITLGNIREGDSRSAVWRFSATSTGSKTIQFRAWSENGGTDNESVVINPVLAQPDLVVDTVFVDKSTLAPNESFTLSATTRNQGTGSSPGSTLRYLLSGDSTIDTGDTLMSTDGISPLAPGGSDPDSDPETAPSSPGTYWVGGCADAVAGESSTTNNCSVGVEIVVQTCSAPETLSISNYTVSTVELFEACLWISIGPNFTVEGPGGHATFKSESLRVGNGFQVLAGGTATFDNDPPL